MKTIQVNSTLIGIEKLNDYIRRIEAGERITEINFEKCLIGDEGTKRLVNALLKNNVALEKLNLARNNISDEGVKELATILENNTTLQKLDLFGNNIGYEGLKVIIAVLEHNTTLQSIPISFSDENLDRYYNLIEPLLLRNGLIHDSVQKIIKSNILKAKIFSSSAGAELPEDILNLAEIFDENIIEGIEAKESLEVQGFYDQYFDEYGFSRASNQDKSMDSDLLAYQNRVKQLPPKKSAANIEKEETKEEPMILSGQIKKALEANDYKLVEELIAFNNQELTLDLTNVASIDKDGVIAISNGLKKNNILTFIDFSNTHINEDSLEFLVEALKFNPNVTDFYLSEDFKDYEPTTLAIDNISSIIERNLQIEYWYNDLLPDVKKILGLKENPNWLKSLLMDIQQRNEVNLEVNYENNDLKDSDDDNELEDNNMDIKRSHLVQTICRRYIYQKSIDAEVKQKQRRINEKKDKYNSEVEMQAATAKEVATKKLEQLQKDANDPELEAAKKLSVETFEDEDKARRNAPIEENLVNMHLPGSNPHKPSLQDQGGGKGRVK